MVESETITEERPIKYLEDLKKLKSPHKEIQEIINKHIQILEQNIVPMRQTMVNINHHKGQIDTQLSDEEFKDVYSNIEILSTHYPNYEREIKNWNTLKQKEVLNLILFAKELIDVSSKIEKQIIKEPIVQKEPVKTEQEKIAFEEKQKQDLMSMKQATSKVEFNIIRNKIKGSVKTKEEEMLSDNICLEIFGKKLSDLEWIIGKKK